MTKVDVIGSKGVLFELKSFDWFAYDFMSFGFKAA